MEEVAKRRRILSSVFPIQDQPPAPASSGGSRERNHRARSQCRGWPRWLSARRPSAKNCPSAKATSSEIRQQRRRGRQLIASNSRMPSPCSKDTRGGKRRGKSWSEHLDGSNLCPQRQLPGTIEGQFRDSPRVPPNSRGGERRSGLCGSSARSRLQPLDRYTDRGHPGSPRSASDQRAGGGIRPRTRTLARPATRHTP